MYDDIALFIQTVKHQSLSAAAQFLGIPAATMTRRLQKLEHQLGVKLLHRSARQFVLTSEGTAYYYAYKDLYSELEQVTLSLQQDTHDLKGYLKVLAPTNISIGALQSMWSEFIQRYPDIQLELCLNNSVQDLLTLRADLALRIGPQKDSSLHQKRLGTLKTRLVASPEYLSKHGAPTTLEELTEHQLLGATALIPWQLTHQHTLTKNIIQTGFSTIASDLTFIKQLTQANTGISLLPDSETYAGIKEGKLSVVLPEWSGANRELFVVWPSGKLLNARAKCLRSFIIDYVENRIMATE